MTLPTEFDPPEHAPVCKGGYRFGMWVCKLCRVTEEDECVLLGDDPDEAEDDDNRARARSMKGA